MNYTEVSAVVLGVLAVLVGLAAVPSSHLRKPLAAVCVLLAMVAGGVGLVGAAHDGPKPNPSSGPLSPADVTLAQWATAANQQCETFTPELRSYGERSDQAMTWAYQYGTRLDEAVQAANAFAELGMKDYSSLLSIRAPRDSQQLVNDTVSYVRNAFARVMDAAEAVYNRDQAAYDAAAAGHKSDAEQASVGFERLGARDCGSIVK